MQHTLIAEECPECKKIALITYRDGLDVFEKCKECGYIRELPIDSKKVTAVPILYK